LQRSPRSGPATGAAPKRLPQRSSPWPSSLQVHTIRSLRFEPGDPGILASTSSRPVTAAKAGDALLGTASARFGSVHSPGKSGSEPCTRGCARSFCRWPLSARRLKDRIACYSAPCRQGATLCRLAHGTAEATRRGRSLGKYRELRRGPALLPNSLLCCTESAKIAFARSRGACLSYEWSCGPMLLIMFCPSLDSLH